MTPDPYPLTNSAPKAQQPPQPPYVITKPAETKAQTWQKYRKFFVAAAGAAISIALTFAPHSHYTILAVALATAAGVWKVPNAS